ncbi:cation diffusion facilitator family transporter [Nevskia soli]|uniref:cation diffusion facilitator family transporter n=1 Tax=Nevskia soli TaxID=418856 RepID=UPI0004A6B52C|nr:cation diffusion facilitator family transporter [Nevskia soli]
MSPSRFSLTRYAWLSVIAALAVLALKLGAWKLTGSVALLSDALETCTNLGGAVMALLMLRLAAQPPDDEHAYGHSKAEYFSSGFEGMLIFLAAAVIVVQALPGLWKPHELQQADIGLAVAAVATVINFAVARLLALAGARHHSISLQADSRHLMADVWTTLGVIVGVALATLTGWLWLDPLVALLVAANVLWEGYTLVRESAMGLMDAAWPEDEQNVLHAVLGEFRTEGVDFHAVRTRRSAARRFVNFHVLVPGSWTVKQGHDLVERVEQRLAEKLPYVTAFTHLEPSDDPCSYGDEGLDRM